MEKAREPRKVMTLIAEKAAANALCNQLTADMAKLIKDHKKTTKDLEVSLDKATKNAATKEANAATKANAGRVALVNEVARLQLASKEMNAALKAERTALTKSGTLTDQLRKQIADMVTAEKGRLALASVTGGTVKNKELNTELSKAKDEISRASAEHEANIEKLGSMERQSQKALKKEGKKIETLEKEISDLKVKLADEMRKSTESSEMHAKHKHTELSKAKDEISRASAEHEANIEKLRSRERLSRKALKKEGKKRETLEKEISDLKVKLAADEMRKSTESSDMLAKHKHTKAKVKHAEKELVECKGKVKHAEEALVECKGLGQRTAIKLEKAVASAAKHKARAQELRVRAQDLQVRLEVESSHRKLQENVGSSSASGKFTSPPTKKRFRGGSFGGIGGTPITPMRMESLGEDEEDSIAAVGEKEVLKRLSRNMTKHNSVTIQCRRRISKWQISSRGTT